MFRMSSSELTVRIILAFGFLVVGINFVREKGSGLPNTGSATTDQSPVPISVILQKEKNSPITATNPQDFKIASGQLQIVEFYSPDDSLSDSTVTLMHTFENRYQGQVNFVFLDVLDPRNKPYLEKLNDLFYPQFTILDGAGHILDQWIAISDVKMASAIANARLREPLW